MFGIHAAWAAVLGAAIITALSGCQDSRATAPAEAAMTLEEARTMQERLIDMHWSQDWQSAAVWFFGKTGRFVFRTHDEDGSLSRHLLPKGFPEGQHRGYEGDWCIREDGLRLTNILPATFRQPGTRPTKDEPGTSDYAATVVIHWADIGEGGPQEALIIDGRTYSVAPIAGGIALRNIEQLEQFLTHGSFGATINRGSDVAIVWSFESDGRVAAWSESLEQGEPRPARIVSQLPNDALRISGQWQVSQEPPDDLDLVFSLNKNKSQLVLSDVRIEGGEDDGRVIEELIVPLGWVDGKLRIEIDSVMYMGYGPA